jgi:hypothetical protein
MVRSFLTGIVAALALLLVAPGGAQARVSCGAERNAPTSANAAQVSDAIFCLTNQVRASYGLTAFRRDARLDASAVQHSQDMAARDYFAHVTPEGLTPSDRAAAQGYLAGAGENIADGYDSAAAVMLAWMGSAGHCRNILGPARDIGIGTSAAGMPYYTQAFGDYSSTVSGSVSGGCPYSLDLDTLVVPEQTSQAGATPLAAIAAPAADAPPPLSGPVLGGLALSPVRLTAGAGGSAVYTLSAPATVTFRVQRAVAGRRAGGRCVVARASKRFAPRCTRWLTLAGRLTDAGEEGANEFAFRARLRGRPLAPGRYRLRAVARDAAGGASSPQLARFRIVRR